MSERTPEGMANFLDEAARYFRLRPTDGEDSRHWSNVYNAENCEAIAAYIRQQSEPAKP